MVTSRQSRKPKVEMGLKNGPNRPEAHTSDNSQWIVRLG